MKVIPEGNVSVTVTVPLEGPAWGLALAPVSGSSGLDNAARLVALAGALAATFTRTVISG